MPRPPQSAIARGSWAIWLLFSLLSLASTSCSSQPQADEAARPLAERLEVAKRLRDPVKRARMLVPLALEQRETGDLVGAESTLKQALKSSETIQEDRFRAASQQRIASAMIAVGSNAEAEQLLPQVAQLAVTVEPISERIAIVGRLAEVYGRQLKRVNTGVSFLNDCESWLEQLGSVYEQRVALSELAKRYHRIGKRDDALRIVESLGRLADASQGREQIECLVAQASALRGLDALPEAIRIMEPLLAGPLSIDDDAARAFALMTILAEAEQLELDTTPLEAPIESAIQQIRDPGVQAEARQQFSKLRP